MGKNKVLYLSFILPILLMVVITFDLGLYPFSDKTLNSGDFNLQYLPLYTGLKEMIRSGDFHELFWSFKKSLGGAMAPVWGFNSLSPLTFLYAFVPTNYFSELTFVITLLRYGLMGLSFAYYLLTRYSIPQQKTYLPLIFALCYAFSGFMVGHTINPNFLDNLIYFPLLLLSIEKVLDGDFTWKFPFLVALTIFTQYYIAYMVCLFFCVYSIYYLIRREGHVSAKILTWLKTVGLLLLGVGLASVWLFPVISGLLESKAAAAPIFEWRWNLLNNPVHLLAKFVIGSFDSQEWGNPEALPQLFIGSIGFIGLIHYFFSENFSLRDKIATLIMIVFFILSFTLEFPDRLWHMGQRPNGFYFRNAWTATGFLLLTGYRSLSKGVRIQQRYLKWFIFTILLVLSLIYRSDYTFIEGWQLGVTLIIWLGLVFLMVSRSTSFYICTGILLISILDLGLNASIGLQRTAYFLSHQQINKLVTPEINFQDMTSHSGEFNRLEMNKGVLEANAPFIYHYNGVSHFTSSLEYQLVHNLGKLGLPTSTSFVNYTNRLPLTDSLFNIQYFVDTKPVATNQPDLLATYSKTDVSLKNHQLYQNDYAFGPAIMVERAFNDYQLLDDPIKNQKNILQLLFNNEELLFQPQNIQEISVQNLTKNGLTFIRNVDGVETKLEFTIIPNDKTAYYLLIPAEASYAFKQSQIMLNGEPYLFADRFTSDQIWPVAYHHADHPVTFSLTSRAVADYPLDRMVLYRFDIEKFKDLISQQEKNNLILEAYQPWLFKFKLPREINETQPVFTSIPYNSGWKVKVGNDKVKTYKVWDTFLGFDLSPGTQSLEIKYFPPGLKSGAVISLISLSTLFLLSWFFQKKGRYSS